MLPKPYPTDAKLSGQRIAAFAGGLMLLAACIAGTPSVQHAVAEEKWQTLPQPLQAPYPDAEDFVEANGVRLYYQVHGAGEPVVLLHGGLGNADYWGGQVAALSAAFAVVTLDSRGHGRSTWDGNPIDYHAMAADVLAVLDHLSIEKASIVGWSDGANVGLDIAIHTPARVVRLLAFGANYSPQGLKSPQKGNTTFARYFRRAVADFELISGRANELPQLRNALRKMWKSEPKFTADQLKAISVPVVVLFGAHDEIIRRGHAEKLARLIPTAEFRVMENVSHFAMWQDPAAFNAEILAFLNK